MRSIETARMVWMFDYGGGGGGGGEEEGPERNNLGTI